MSRAIVAVKGDVGKKSKVFISSIIGKDVDPVNDIKRSSRAC
jgi:hypothetical protein